ncbi:CIPK9, partial [Symbiodinium pilosum]
VSIGFLRPFRFLLGTLTAAARMAKQTTFGNATDYCCQCFVDIYEQHFEKFSSHAYIEVAVSALPLRDARKLASKNSKRQVAEMGSLNGTTFIFQLICGALVWWAGYFIVYLTVGGFFPGLEGYGDPLSGYYVGHPGVWSNVGGIVSVVVAFPYMMVFDAASNTILYCVLVDVLQQQERSGFRFWSNKWWGWWKSNSVWKWWNAEETPRNSNVKRNLRSQCSGISSSSSSSSLWSMVTAFSRGSSSSSNS